MIHYTGNGKEGVHYVAEQQPNGTWGIAFMTIFDDIWPTYCFEDPGPYVSESEAEESGRRNAIQMCIDNQVECKESR